MTHLALTSFSDESSTPTHFEVLNYREDGQVTSSETFSLHSVGAVFTSLLGAYSFTANVPCLKH